MMWTINIITVIIICNIHQPSLALFQYFDNLLLLRRGQSMV
jgi:hypothetical protein